MQVSQVVHNSKIYGPGMRTVVWTQGCSIRCPGCWNDKLWDFKGGETVLLEMLLESTIRNGDTGITILGGEPLDQAEKTLQLIELFQKNDLSVMLYTGYEKSELSPFQLACYNTADIVIIGRYIDSLRSEELLWRGSSNQQIIWNCEIPEGINLSERRQSEIHLNTDGKMQILGYPSKETLTEVNKTYGSLRSLAHEQ